VKYTEFLIWRDSSSSKGLFLKSACKGKRKSTEMKLQSGWLDDWFFQVIPPPSFGLMIFTSESVKQKRNLHLPRKTHTFITQAMTLSS